MNFLIKYYKLKNFDEKFNNFCFYKELIYKIILHILSISKEVLSFLNNFIMNFLTK